MAENNSSAPLLPCPFCGGEAAVQKESPADNSGGYFVDCNSCRASTNLRYACGDNPVPLLMERWNARAPSKTAEGAYPALPEPVSKQFQGNDDGWYGFMDARHEQATMRSGKWPIRELFTAEQMRAYAAQAVAAQAPTGNWINADDVSRLARDLDVALHGEDGAASQAALCDVVGLVKEAARKLGRPVLAAQAAPAAVAVPDDVASALDRMDALLQPGLGLLAVGDESATAKASRRDMATVRAALAATPALPATEDSSAGDLAEEKIADEMSREERMIVLQRDSDGTPTVWCDPEIADIVCALNSCGLKTVASCSGHGVKPGGIALADGRQLLLLESLEAFNSAMSAITQAEVQAEPVAWDGKLPGSLQRALNEMRVHCKPPIVSGLEFEVRQVFEGMHTSLSTVRRMYWAANARLEAIDDAQPDPFAAPQAQPADALDAKAPTLVEILAAQWATWPAEQAVEQTVLGDVFCCVKGRALKFGTYQIASDQDSAVVTPSQWARRRAAMASAQEGAKA